MAAKAIRNALAVGLQRIWSCDPVLCKNIVARELMLATAPTAEWGINQEKYQASKAAAEEYVRDVEEHHATNLQEDRLPELHLAEPKEEERFHTGHVMRALRCVPLEKLASDPDELAWVLDVTDTAVRWTVARLEADATRDRLSRSQSAVIPAWLSFLGDWLARLAPILSNEAAEKHVLHPLRNSWPASAGLTAGFMNGYIDCHLADVPISESFQVHWRAVADWVIPAEPLPATRWHHLNREQEEAHQLVVFVHYGHCAFTENWEGAAYFVDVIDQWVATLAHRQDAFRAFLVFLKGPGRQLPPKRIVRWLAEAVSRMEEPESVLTERGTGTATAQELAHAWLRGPDEIRADVELAAQYVALLDKLVTVGVRLAASLRTQFR